MNKVIFEEIKKLAEQGNAEAQYKFGVMYAKGEGTKRNFEEALFWYEKSAINEFSDAQYILGYIYYNGEGVEDNREKGVYWMEKSWGNGNEKARNFLEKNEVKK